MLPLVGFLLMLTSVVHKINRTGEILKSPLAKYPNDAFESLLLWYGNTWFLSGLLAPLIYDVVVRR